MSSERTRSRLPKTGIRPSADPHSKAVPSQATLEEVQVFLGRYADEVNANLELSQTSKAMYIDFAGCFVRWMYGGFQPGSRGGRLRGFTKIRTKSHETS